MTALTELRGLLRTLFQLDQPELDFGLYRIMHAKSSELTKFLDSDLLPQIKRTLATLKISGDRAHLEDEVLSDLYTFFARYYHAGDFLTLPRYKRNVYMVPYQGQEVLLHWANADQYYVKSSEDLRSYAFRLPSGKRVRFEYAPVPEDDVAVEASKTAVRVALSNVNPFAVGAPDESELIVSFVLRNVDKDITQESLTAEAEELLRSSSAIEGWKAELLLPAAGSAQPARTHFARHLERFTSRHAFDYFIHKDLSRFLTWELNLFLKNEILNVDDILAGNAAAGADVFARAAGFRVIANKLIAFLAQLEDFQKRLWLKKKFVVASNWCVTIDRVPRKLYPEILLNQAQMAEWKEEFKITPRNETDLAKNPTLVVDTVHFSREFVGELLSELDSSAVDGILVRSDNFHALRLLEPRFRDQVRCIYIDPPFNTDGDGFAYKDSYRHSSWLTMMDNRCSLGSRFLAPDGTLYAHIDYNEKERLKLLLDRHLTYITEIIWRNGWVSGYKSAAHKFIRNHDTIYQFARSDSPHFVKQYIPYPEDYERRGGGQPTGKGIPLEDTWNCSTGDTLHSIQHMSFDKEKLGDRSLTQKNENLLERMITSSSDKGDWVMDFFLGSGTTAAASHKLARRWIGIEAGDQFDKYALPRMKRVLFGERRGISEKCGWKGGGSFQYLRLESYDDTLRNLKVQRSKVQDELFEADSKLREDYVLNYMLDVESRATLLGLSRFERPFSSTLETASQLDGTPGPTTIDLVETFNWLLGLTVVRRWREAAWEAVYGTTPGEERVLALWCDREAIDDEALLEVARKAELFSRELDVVYVTGDSLVGTLRRSSDRWRIVLLEDEFHRLMFASDGE